MTKRSIIIWFVVLFCICLVGFNYSKKVKEKKNEASAHATVIETVDDTENKTVEPDHKVNDEPADKKAEKEEKKEPEVDKKDIQERIESYLEQGKIGKAKDLFEKYEDLGLKADLIKRINEMETEYVLEATEKAKDEYFANYDADAAKDIILDCEKKVGKGNEMLEDYKNLFGSCNTIRLTSLDCVDGGDCYPKAQTSFTDALGNEYTDGLYMSADPYAFDGVYGVYYIDNYDVNTFKGTITPYERLLTTGREYKIFISTMDANQEKHVLYTSPAITKTTLPFEINLDIGDDPFLIVECTRGSDISGPLGGAYIVDPVIYSKLTEDDFDELNEF